MSWWPRRQALWSLAAVLALVCLPSAQACSLALDSFGEAEWLDPQTLLVGNGGGLTTFDTEQGTSREWPSYVFDHVIALPGQGAVLHRYQEGLGGDCSGDVDVALRSPAGDVMHHWEDGRSPMGVGVDSVALVVDGELTWSDLAGQTIANWSMPASTYRSSLAVAAGGVVMVDDDGGIHFFTRDGEVANLTGASYGAASKTRSAALIDGPRGAIIQHDDQARMWILDAASMRLTHRIELPDSDMWGGPKVAVYGDGFVVHYGDQAWYTDPQKSVRFGLSGQVETFPPSVSPDDLPTMQEGEPVVRNIAASDGLLAVFSAIDGRPHEIVIFDGLAERGRWYAEEQATGATEWRWEPLEAGQRSQPGELDWNPMDMPLQPTTPADDAPDAVLPWPAWPLPVLALLVLVRWRRLAR